jgi:23S rRNA (cytidine1920-2'-O)/16S rRNA (cytidine1409-2'-O)-methyltransferase
MNKRLDVAAAEALNISRTTAKRLVAEGAVLVNGKTAKPSALINDGDEITASAENMPKYVSRGGLKLEFALDYFGVSVQGLNCVDVGASTGGFTDCLLKRGAASVLCVDTGKNQLDETLLLNPRVTNLSETNVNALNPRDYAPFGFACADVSFVSLKKVLPAVFALAAPNAPIIALIKPQFEVGRANIGKNGVVKSEKARLNAVNSIKTFCGENGAEFKGYVPSPIKGGSGNVEFLCLINSLIRKI